MPTDALRYPEERRLTTVLFADVKGFTALAEQLDFETVSDLLKGIWNRLDKAIENHNGYIDKHLGDGVMCIWGAPFAGENDAEQAVAAGLDLIKALDEYCQNSSIPGAKNLKLRVGVNTGYVFAGYVGTRHEYTVIGDTVNMASRLEQIADAGKVVIGENTLRMVQDIFSVRKLDPTIAKGKTELLQPYEIQDRLPMPGHIHIQNTDNLVAHMIGRDEELDKLALAYKHSLETDKPSMVIISGDVGIGKTRLLREFGRLLEKNNEKVTVLSTQGFTRTSKLPFALWRSLLRNHFEIRAEDPLPESREKWHRGIDGMWGKMDTHNLKTETMKVLGDLFGPPQPDQVFSEEQLQRIFFLGHELLRRFSSQKRTLLVLDDLQWADRESLQLLAYLLTKEDVPLKIMIIGATRPEFFKNQSQWHNLARVINLNPLDLTPQHMIEAYPALSSLPDPILEEVSLHAEGNPYFLGEIIKSLVKGGVLGAEVDPKEIHSQLLEKIPQSLLGTLQARMDNLSREARTVALLASVVGRVFWVGAVLSAARSVPLPGSAPLINVPELVIDRFIQDGLRQLVRADLAYPRIGSKFSDEQEYIFKNSYLRDVAYSLIPNRNRAQYHKAIAEWMLQVPDHAFEEMARDHQRRSSMSAKISTGDLSHPLLDNEKKSLSPNH